MKLRARLRNLHYAFGVVMRNRGSVYRLEEDDEDSSWEDECPEDIQDLINKCHEDFEPEEMTRSELIDGMQKQASTNRGMEWTGEANGELVRQVFRARAVRWRGIAWRHIELSLEATREFVEGLCHHISGADALAARGLVNAYADPYLEVKREELRAKLDELLHPYFANGCGIPIEDELWPSFGILRQLRSPLAERLEKCNPELFGPKASGGLDSLDICEAIDDLDDKEGERFSSARVISLMEEFYDVSSVVCPLAAKVLLCWSINHPSTQSAPSQPSPPT